MTFVLWFEPERVHVGTEFDREHPEYLSQANVGGNRLYNLGDPNARKFLTDFLDARIKEWGVDMVRNDFNLQPLPFWQAADKADRQGITEMQYIEGLYEMWAELLRRNPHITIDNCASGGRRIDIEINSLSYPLWRSDFNDIGEGLKGPQYWPQMAMTDQNMFLGLALYIPFQAGPLWDMQPYSFRSAMTSSVVLYERILHEEFPDELAKQGIAELKELRPLFLGDVYPLTKLSTSQAVWHAYQLARADLGQGCALFFRRPDCPKPTCQVQLHNIDLEAFYMVSQTGETYTKGKPKKMKGRDLARLPVQMDTKPGSILLRYRKVGP
jgi:alpha-galactosidase